MAYYLVTAKPIRSKMNDLRKWLDSGEIQKMRPFGNALQTGLDNARWLEDEVAIWEEEDYCVPPLAQERAAVLDAHFTNLEVQHVSKGEGWKKINALKSLWEIHENWNSIEIKKMFKGLSHLNTKEDINNLQKYLLSVEKLIREQEKQDVNKLTEIASRSSDIEVGNFWAEEYPYWWNIFSTQLRFSFVIWAFAAFEHNLNSMCKYFSTDANPWQRPKDKIMDKAKDFLKGINLFNIDQKIWGNLSENQKIRNFLVHEGVYIFKDNDIANKKAKTIEQIIKRTKGIAIKNQEIVIEEIFCLNLVEDINGFFKAMYFEFDENTL